MSGAANSDPRGDLAGVAKIELKKRRQQVQILPGVFDANPAMMMMLELYVLEAEHARSQTTYLIEQAGLPKATGLRWLAHMSKVGLVRRMLDENDRRSKYVELTKAGRSTMEDYLIICHEVESPDRSQDQ